MKKELTEGRYYYTIKGIEVCHICEVDGIYEIVTPKGEVLDEVPSYDEYNAIKTKISILNKDKQNLNNILLKLEEVDK